MTEYEITHGLSQDAPGPLEPVEPVEVAKVPESMNTEWKLVNALRDSLLWTASSLAAIGKEQDVITMDGRKRTVGEILDEANEALNVPDDAAPTSHPIPTGATGDRDWELSCDECNGSGHVFVKHQVAERKTDVQEFKEECEACEGRGFNIAFEDIPGIAEYVKSCRPAATVATGEDERQAFEAWFTRNDVTKDMATRAVRRGPGGDYVLMQTYTAWEVWQAARASVDAPAAGDARDAARLDFLFTRQATVIHDETSADGYWLQFRKEDGSTWVQVGEYPTPRAAIDAAIAASKQGGE